MRVLAIIPSTLRGGVEEYTLRITSAAVKEGWEVHVAFPQTEGTASLIKDFTANGVSYHRLEISESNLHGLAAVRKYLIHFVRTALLLLKVKPNVAQIVLPSITYCLGSILACSLLQVPTLVRFGLVYFKWPFGAKKLKIYAWARARKQQWVTISENNRKLVCETFQIPAQEIVYIYNGANIESSYNQNKEDLNKLRSEVIQELGIPINSQLALTVGRLENQKGYIDLIPAIPHIAEEFPDIRFVWVGDGTQQSKLASMLREYGVAEKVIFLGYRSDVPRLLKAADIFVFPTHYEGGQSWAIAEAMAYGLPIVTSDASGIPEVIKHKTHGLVFKTGDSCDLLENLRWALRNPDKMQEMAQNAQLRAKDFSEERMVKETLEVWQKLAGNFR
ncbi:glycosyltransferase [Lyngbya aestuarii]|uniref:glycosyltransferase n=1 Tax=Lyngbya aestuarii TaxID=118322 RepID=UPI00403DF499